MRDDDKGVGGKGEVNEEETVTSVIGGDGDGVVCGEVGEGGEEAYIIHSVTFTSFILSHLTDDPYVFIQLYRSLIHDDICFNRVFGA